MNNICQSLAKVSKYQLDSKYNYPLEQNNLKDVLKVNNKSTRITPLMSL